MRGASSVGSGGDGYARVPTGALDDKLQPFLHPKPRSLVAVPLEFRSAKHWAELIGHNLLAEFWQVYRESKGRGVTMDGVAFEGGRVQVQAGASALDEGMQYHLLLFSGRSLHLVIGQDPPDLVAGTIGLSLRPVLHERGKFRCKSLGSSTRRP